LTSRLSPSGHLGFKNTNDLWNFVKETPFEKSLFCNADPLGLSICLEKDIAALVKLSSVIGGKGPISLIAGAY